MNIGIIYALATYILWAIFPIYWKQLHHVSATQLIGHRIIWAFIMMLLFIISTRQWKTFREKLDGKTLRAHGFASLLLGANWLIYVWAVNNGFIIESSLGYFINPLFTVLMGMICLKEKLRPIQWIPLSLATLGVLYLTFAYGRLPWIALGLATTFGFYGLLKKQSSLGSLYGLTLETGIIIIPALAYLFYTTSNGEGVFLIGNVKTDFLLIGAGLVTAVPLLLFAKAVKSISLTTIGLMQYIAPTGQFLIGVLIYKEAFSSSQAVGFGMIWIALIFFWVEGWLQNRAEHAIISVQKAG